MANSVLKHLRIARYLAYETRALNQTLGDELLKALDAATSAGHP